MYKLLPLIVLIPFIISSCGNSSDAKNSDKSDASSAAPVVSMQPLDLSSKGIPFTIKAPVGATVTLDTSAASVAVKKDRFSIEVREEKYEDDKTVAQVKDAQFKTDSENRPDLGLTYDIIKSEPAGYIILGKNNAGGKTASMWYMAEKDKKKYIFTANILDLAGIHDNGFSVSPGEVQVMYDAVKQQ